MNLPLVRLTLTHLLTTVLRDLFSTNETVRNDYQFDKFKSAVLYSRHNFKCLEKKKLDGAIYIKFSSTLSNLNDMKLLEMITSLISLKAQYFIADIISNA